MSLYSSSDCHYSTKCQFVNINIYTYSLVQSTKHERALLCTAFNKIQPKYGGKYHEHTNGTEEKYFILSENLIFRHFWVSFFFRKLCQGSIMDFMLSSYMAMTSIIPIPRNMPQAWKTRWKKGFSPDLVSTDIISGNWKRITTKNKVRKHYSDIHVSQ